MIVALLFIFILLQIADCLTTVHILKQGGREANPLMNWLFDTIGIPTALVIMKLIVIGVMIWAWNIYATLCGLMIYICVIAWNSYQIYKTK